MRNSCRHFRRGVTSIELIMVMIVLILATFVSLQFGIALIVKQTVAQAASVAAREAAKGADPDELEEVIERVLAGHQIELGPDASFVLENPNPVLGPGMVLPTRGAHPCTPPATPAIDADEIRVTVCVSLTVHPILNILEDYGIDYTGRSFTISSVATRESPP